jgi:hypothetical protein
MRLVLPGWHWSLVLALGVGALGCSEESTSDGGHRGTLRVVIVEGGPGEGGARYFLELRGTGEVIPLKFAGRAPEPRSGVPFVMFGEHAENELRVSRFEVDVDDPELGRLEEALVDPPSTQERKTVLVPLDFGEGVSIDDPAAYFARTLFSTTQAGPKLGFGNSDRSMNQYYAETSYGILSTPGDVAPVTSYNGNPCQNYGAPMANSLRGAIGDYDSYIWFYGSEQGSPCGGGGWGSQGTWNNHEHDAWMNNGLWPTAIPHEVGHNIGLMHASSMRCNGQRFADDPRTCTTEEYGNPFTIMGNGGVGHLSGMEKWYTKAFGGCNGVRVRATGTFNLLPIEVPCDGIQTLQVPMPKTRFYDTEQSEGENLAQFYYLELRTNVGLDSGTTPQVVVHVSDEVSSPNQIGGRSVVLDMTPTTSNWQLPFGGFEGLKAGETFDDPAGGVSFKVDSIGSEGAVITVTLQNSTGTTECLDGSDLEGNGPTSCSGDEPGTGGTGGMGGTGGSGGAGGSAGSGGSTAGAGGTGGGSGGTGGLAGSGAGGSGGTGGSGAGTAGAAGSPAGGSAGSGTAGAAGSFGTPSGVQKASNQEEGCGCRVPGGQGREAAPWSLFASAGVLVGLRRRKSRARSA